MFAPEDSQSALYREALQARIDYATIPLSDSGLIMLKGIARQATIALLTAEGPDAINRLGQEIEQFLKNEERSERLRRVLPDNSNLLQQIQEEQQQADK